MTFADTASSRTLEHQLGACGWDWDAAGRCWRRWAGEGQAVLRPIAERAGWRQFELDGGAVPRAESERVLAAQCRLWGPVKFVSRADGSVFCRADLPTEFAPSAQPAPGDFDHGTLTDPVQAWARAVTAIVTGEHPAPGEPVRLDDSLVAQLGRDGYSASLDDGDLHVHVHMPGLFREISIRDQPSLGATVTADLLSLEDLPDASREAAIYLAQRASDRIGLARMAVANDTAAGDVRVLVHVGWAPIPGVWLMAALEAVELAITLTAREMAALRDRELAVLVLAARAA